MAFIDTRTTTDAAAIEANIAWFDQVKINNPGGLTLVWHEDQEWLVGNPDCKTWQLFSTRCGKFTRGGWYPQQTLIPNKRAA